MAQRAFTFRMRADTLLSMPSSSSGRVLAAVLFTDIVNSTAVAEELGDRTWKVLIPCGQRPGRSRCFLERAAGRSAVGSEDTRVGRRPLPSS